MICARLILAGLRKASKAGLRGVPCRLYIGLSLWNRMDFSAFRRGITPLARIRRAALIRHRFGRIQALIAARISGRIARALACIRRIMRDCENLPLYALGVRARFSVKRISARCLFPGSIRPVSGSRFSGHLRSRMSRALRRTGRRLSVDDDFKLPMEPVRVSVAPRFCRDKYCGVGIVKESPALKLLHG